MGQGVFQPSELGHCTGWALHGVGGRRESKEGNQRVAFRLEDSQRKAKASQGTVGRMRGEAPSSRMASALYSLYALTLQYTVRLRSVYAVSAILPLMDGTQRGEGIFPQPHSASVKHSQAFWDHSPF